MSTNGLNEIYKQSYKSAVAQVDKGSTPHCSATRATILPEIGSNSPMAATRYAMPIYAAA